jgi:hypothetical protein
MAKQTPIPPTREKQSAGLVQIVGVFYALVLGQTIISNQSFFLIRNKIAIPLHHSHSL